MTQGDTGIAEQKYLQEAPQEEAMQHWGESQGNTTPLTHTIWTFEFMGLGSHNIACPVCFNAGASLHRDVTPGQYKQTVQPCAKCRTQGWVIAKRPKSLKLLWKGWWE